MFTRRKSKKRDTDREILARENELEQQRRAIEKEKLERERLTLEDRTENLFLIFVLTYSRPSSRRPQTDRSLLFKDQALLCSYHALTLETKLVKTSIK